VHAYDFDGDAPVIASGLRDAPLMEVRGNYYSPFFGDF
jgi:hypothetical protein